MITNENLFLLSQLVLTLEQLGKKLKEFYLKKDIENYEKTKKEILKINSQISKVIK